jgi:hypothetical protein
MKGLPDYLPTIHPNPSDLIGVSTAGGVDQSKIGPRAQ